MQLKTLKANYLLTDYYVLSFPLNPHHIQLSHYTDEKTASEGQANCPRWHEMVESELEPDVSDSKVLTTITMPDITFENQSYPPYNKISPVI